MLLQYYFKQIHGKTSLESITEVMPEFINMYPEIYYPGYTQYWKQSPMPKNYKQPRRFKTEHWIAYVNKTQEEDTLSEIFSLLTTPPFTKSIGDRGEYIPPVKLPIKRPVGRPRKIVIPLRQIVVCRDLQSIAKLRGEEHENILGH